MELKSKRVLVVGACGFIGSHLCRSLSGLGASVSGLTRGSIQGKDSTADCYQVDITQRLELMNALRELRPEMVVHMASHRDTERDIHSLRAGYEVNLVGTLNLVEACQELSGIERLVFLGSCEEYGLQAVPFCETSRECPASAYAATKLAATQLLQVASRSYELPAVILRPSVVYGPGQGLNMFLPALIDAIIRGNRFEMTGGMQSRDYVYVEDVVNAIQRSMTVPGIDGQVINISSARPIRIKELANRVVELAGSDAEKSLEFGAREYRRRETMDYWASNQRADELLSWKPTTSLEVGLQKTIAYFKTTVGAG